MERDGERGREKDDDFKHKIKEIKSQQTMKIKQNLNIIAHD